MGGGKRREGRRVRGRVRPEDWERKSRRRETDRQEAEEMEREGHWD